MQGRMLSEIFAAHPDILTPAIVDPDWAARCNGQVLMDSSSPLNGKTIPNLNGASSGTQRFLRGCTTSGGTGGADTCTIGVANLPAHCHGIPTVGGVCCGNPVVYTGVCSLGQPECVGVYTKACGSGTAISILVSYLQVVWYIVIR